MSLRSRGVRSTEIEFQLIQSNPSDRKFSFFSFVFCQFSPNQRKLMIFCLKKKDQVEGEYEKRSWSTGITYRWLLLLYTDKVRDTRDDR